MASPTGGSGNARPRAAVVIQRFLEDTGGGAEEHCRRLVLSLSQDLEIDVLTTCARDHHTWANELPAGPSAAGGFRVLRFPVARTKRRTLSAILSRALFHLPHPAPLEDLWVRSLGPYSPELLEFIEREAPRYQVVIFYTYLYATTVFGLPRAGPRTLLIPTAHDEPALRLARHLATLRAAGALCFLTPEEEELVKRVAGPLSAPRLVLGAELDPRAFTPGDGPGFRRQHGVEGPFLLYLGRIERSKGLREILAIYRRMHSRTPALVLAGRPGPLRVPRWARCLGYLSEEDKRGALAACEALVQPSARESLSLVLLEAWAQRRPVVVNRRCAPLAGQCRRSGGGLGYAGAAEFMDLLPLLADPRRRDALGENGFRYTQAQYGPGGLRAKLIPFLEKLGWLSAAPAQGAACG